mmetsp:Transcript_47838/g.114754  ORF Transcript_47838/g.114754 Transcript_47838/m.114754 type:complete len:141 (+) Transcript_47838:27-449(+)
MQSQSRNPRKAEPTGSRNIVKGWFHATRNRPKMLLIFAKMKRQFFVGLILNALLPLVIAFSFDPEKAIGGHDRTRASTTLTAYSRMLAFCNFLFLSLPLCPWFSMTEGVIARLCNLLSLTAFLDMGLLLALGSNENVPGG